MSKFAIAKSIACSTLFAGFIVACASTPSKLGAPKAVSLSDSAKCLGLAQSFAAMPDVPMGLKLSATFNQGGIQAPNNMWRPPAMAQGPELPAHCIVSGVLDQRVGSDGKPYETRFELRLPNVWSGRLLYQGGGGNDGIVNPATGRNTGSLGDYGSALARGFAAVTTDAGHQGPGPEFGVEPQARVDKAYAAHDKVARTAKALIAGYYGQAVGRSYFLGCSGGGRQGMMFAQRYPTYFDGVIAVAPAMSVAGRATPAAAWDTQLFLNIAPRDANGQPILSRAFSPGDLSLVAKGVLAACDAQDGLTDGMVNHVKACKFKVESLQCSGAKTEQCLSQAQVNAMDAAFKGPIDQQGKAVYTAQSWDPGIAAPGWRAWKLGNSSTAQHDANNVRLMGAALGLVFATPPEASLNTTNFALNKDLQKLENFSRIYDTYRDDKMNPFFDQGGKFMIVHGVADGIFTANDSINYFERLASNHGGLQAVQSKAALFLVPGMNHCAGGPSTDNMDALQTMTDWVEKGQKPESMLAKAQPNHPQFPNRSRPLCPYPHYAHYKGQGNTELAESFECRLP